MHSSVLPSTLLGFLRRLRTAAVARRSFPSFAVIPHAAAGRAAADPASAPASLAAALQTAGAPLAAATRPAGLASRPADLSAQAAPQAREGMAAPLAAASGRPQRTLEEVRADLARLREETRQRHAALARAAATRRSPKVAPSGFMDLLAQDGAPAPISATAFAPTDFMQHGDTVPSPIAPIRIARPAPPEVRLADDGHVSATSFAPTDFLDIKPRTATPASPAPFLPSDFLDFGAVGRGAH